MLGAYVSIVFVNVIWGLSFIASKIALGHGFQPFLLALVRFVMASVVLLPVCLKMHGRPRFSKREWMLLFFSALAGITVYFLFEYIGLTYTTASNASLILSVIPVLTMLASALLHKVRYSMRSWLGVLVSLVGVYFVVRYGGDESARNALVGNMLLVGACLCWVAYLELTNQLFSGDHSTFEITCYQNLIGAVTLAPLALTEMPFGPISGDAWVSAVFLGLICSALCYILYGYSMRRLEPFRTALFINLNPVAAVIGGVLMLGERVSWQQILGGALILLSIAYVNWQQAPLTKEAKV